MMEKHFSSIHAVKCYFTYSVILIFLLSNSYNAYAAYPSVNIVMQDDVEALKHKAEQGDVQAQYNLGMLCEQGKGVPKSYTEAAKWLKKASDKGFVQAQLRLAYYYEVGAFTDMSYVEAAKYYTLAAQQGNAQAMNSLGRYYMDGLGVKKDLNKAKDLFEGALKGGNREAENNLKKLQQLLPADAVKTSTDTKVAAKGKNTETLLEKAKNYWHGKEGVKQDKELAMKYYEEAAKKGNAEAQYTFGFCSNPENYEWIEKAADQGYTLAQVRVGYAYWKGIHGYPQDKEKALALLKEAALSGNTQAKQYVEEIEMDDFMHTPMFWVLVAVSIIVSWGILYFISRRFCILYFVSILTLSIGMIVAYPVSGKLSELFLQFTGTISGIIAMVILLVLMNFINAAGPLKPVRKPYWDRGFQKILLIVLLIGSGMASIKQDESLKTVLDVFGSSATSVKSVASQIMFAFALSFYALVSSFYMFKYRKTRVVYFLVVLAAGFCAVVAGYGLGSTVMKLVIMVLVLGGLFSSNMSNFLFPSGDRFELEQKTANRDLEEQREREARHAHDTKKENEFKRKKEKLDEEIKELQEKIDKSSNKK